MMRNVMPWIVTCGLCAAATAQSVEQRRPLQAAPWMKPDGSLVHRGPAVRTSTVYYDNTGGPYFGTLSQPNSHGGDLIAFAPDNPGLTNTLVNVIVVPVGLDAGAGTGVVGDVIARLWDLSANGCDPTNGVFGTFIGGVRFTTPPLDEGFIYPFVVALDDLFPVNGGLILPNGDNLGIELTYVNADNSPHPTFTFGFAANLPLPGDPNNPINCASDPNNLPTLGSSAEFYLRDTDLDGRLTIGDANGCAGTPNELRTFGGCPNVANFFLHIEFDPPPVANAGPDQTVTDADNNGSETVTLDGSLSTDDSQIDDFTWREGTTVLAGGASPSASVSLAVGVHNITLTATDDLGVTGTDTVRITVQAGGGGCPNHPGTCIGGDTNGDCLVDLSDLTRLLAHFGATHGATRLDGDLEPPGGDGDVDLSDLTALLASFGNDCR